MEMFVPMIPHRWSRSSVALHDLPRARTGAPHVAVRCVSHEPMQPRACLGMCFAPVAVTIWCIWVQHDESELARRCASRAVCRVPGYVGRRREKRICTCQLLSHSDVMGPVTRYSGFDERSSSGVVQSRAWGCTHEHLMSTEAIETKAICSGCQSPSSCSSVICIICKTVATTKSEAPASCEQGHHWLVTSVRSHVIGGRVEDMLVTLCLCQVWRRGLG